MPKPSLQERATATRRTIERVVLNVLALPLTVEKVAGLHLARTIVRRMDDCDLSALGVDFGETRALHESLDAVESACRRSRLFAKFADLPAARKDRLNRIVSGAV